MVEEAGFEAIAASDADEAIRILESRNDIRAVFTDVHMPGSMDGLRLARVVRNRWPPVALIATSGRRSVLKTDLGPVLAKALQPVNRRTGADLELFGRSTSGSPSFHEVNDAHSQLTRIRSMHWPALQRINNKLSLDHIVASGRRKRS
jgi:CheY-like chemotaxis protein